MFCKSQELNSNEFKRSNHVEFSENSYEDKEKSFTPLEQEYDDFDPLEYLGVYNNDKKIEDVHNSSENESDFEKRFFENENTNNLYNLANRNSYQIKSKRLKGLSDNYEISNSPKDNEIINRKKNKEKAVEPMTKVNFFTRSYVLFFKWKIVNLFSKKSLYIFYLQLKP